MALETLFAESKKINVGNTEVEIKQIALKDLPRVVGVAQKIFEGPDVSMPVKITQLIASDFESLLELIKRLTNLDEEQINNLNLASTIMIVSEIIKENTDFLQQNVTPLLQGMGAELKKVKTGSSKSKN